jgi:choline dehydrogenase-like flavoprotein
MLFDFNEAWPRVAEAGYDVCVCGTGPAGITIARKLAAHGKKVLLLEGGGLTYTDESQDHYKGKTVGRTYWVETSRLRQLGGSSGHWGGLCALQDPISFEAHEVNGLPGWPISREEMFSGGLAEAKEILDIAGKNEILDVAGKDPALLKQPAFDSNSFNKYSFALSLPTRFSEKYGAELKQSRQIDAFYNANLTDVSLTDNSARVESFRVQNYKGQQTDVSVAQYVLALGGIENARILLNANHQAKSGIGNHSGMVGRCFMEGLNVPIGRFLVTYPEFWQVESVNLVPAEQLMRQHEIGNGVVTFIPNAPNSLTVQDHGGRLRVLKEFIHETGCFWPDLTRLARRIVDFNCPGDGLISSIIEQEPNPNSRVSLTGDVDSFGLRRVQMNWQLSDGDLKTIRVLSIEAAKEMARLNRARVQLAPFIIDASLGIPVSGFGHHMGTTRMAADPHYGVVDENCRVHGIQNLYVAGSSVFPKCGGRNPTLTIVLLALRLGNFLNKLN